MPVVCWCAGNKHHQRGPGEQSGDGRRGSGPRAGDPEDHRALLPTAGFQRRRPPHQRPSRGAHDCKKQQHPANILKPPRTKISDFFQTRSNFNIYFFFAFFCFLLTEKHFLKILFCHLVHSFLL